MDIQLSDLCLFGRSVPLRDLREFPSWKGREEGGGGL